jgi:hypothetical protein
MLAAKSSSSGIRGLRTMSLAAKGAQLGLTGSWAREPAQPASESQFKQVKAAQARVLPHLPKRVCPVVKATAALARKATTLATSSGVPIRFVGRSRRNYLDLPGLRLRVARLESSRAPRD